VIGDPFPGVKTTTTSRLFHTKFHVCLQLTVGMADGRRLSFSTTEEDCRDIDNAVGFILMSLASIFPAVPTEYVLLSTSTVTESGCSSAVWIQYTYVSTTWFVHPSGHFHSTDLFWDGDECLKVKRSQ